MSPEKKDTPSEGVPLEEEETPEEKRRERKTRIGWLLFFAVLAVLMIVCFVIIQLL